MRRRPAAKKIAISPAVGSNFLLGGHLRCVTSANSAEGAARKIYCDVRVAVCAKEFANCARLVRRKWTEPNPPEG